MPAARSAAPIENSTALPRPPPTSATVVLAWISVGVPVGPISTTRSPGCSVAQRSELPPISSAMTEISPRSLSVQAPVIARPSIASRVRPQAGLLKRAAMHLVVLQAVELAGPEGAGGGRGAQHHLDDGRASGGSPRARVAMQLVAAARDQLGARRPGRRRSCASTRLTTG